MRPPSSRSAISPFLAMEMAREADRLIAQGRTIARFDIGQPCFGAPPAALDAARAAMAATPLGYTEGLGAHALRTKLSAWYARTYGLDIPPTRIAITTGASGAFLLAFLALFDTGDRVALAAPGYPPYRHILKALGMTPVSIDAEPRDKLQLTPAHLETLARQGPIAGALVASPANPTGAMLSHAELAAFAQAAREHGAALISDEIYHGLTYGAPAPTALAVDPDAVVINSFSKYWAMTGWRIGWIVAPERLIGAIERLAQNLTVAPPTPGQATAVAALDAADVCEARRALYADNRALMLAALPGLGFEAVTPPDGAFYILADISAHGEDSAAFCTRALHEAGVAITTGLDFDERRGRRWVRLAYARQTAEVEAGLAQLSHWLKRG